MKPSGIGCLPRELHEIQQARFSTALRARLRGRGLRVADVFCPPMSDAIDQEFAKMVDRVVSGQDRLKAAL
jgi:hypothetical protein